MRRLFCDALAVALGIFAIVLFAPLMLLDELFNDGDPAATYESRYW